MAKKLTVIGELRPRIISRQVVDLEKFAQRICKNTTYNAAEIYAILQLFTDEAVESLKAGETVKVNRLVNISANMRVGGEVDLIVRGDRGTVAELNNPELWTADKIYNYQYRHKTTQALIEIWNTKLHPEDPVEPDPQ